MDEFADEYCERTWGEGVLGIIEGLEFLEDEEENKRGREKKFENFCKISKNIVGKKVEKVVIWKRLVIFLRCIVISICGWIVGMERVVKV